MMLLFDLNHVAYRCLFAVQKDIPTTGWNYFKHAMFNTIFNTCKKFNANEVYLLVDSKENWRKKIFPEYKETRKEKRDKQTQIDWDKFFETFNEFVAEVKMYFPFYVLRIKYLEADDLAGIIASNYQHKKKVIVTSDGDYLQLLKYKNVEIYDPIKMKILSCDDPIKALKMKVLTGDDGDNISAVRPRLGIKTAEKIVNSPELLTEMFEDKTVSYTTVDGKEVTLGQECKDKFKLNSMLIDLTYTPKVFHDLSLKTINEYEFPSGKEIFSYFSENKYRELIRKMDDLEKLIVRINENRELENVFDV